MLANNSRLREACLHASLLASPGNQGGGLSMQTDQPVEENGSNGAIAGSGIEAGRDNAQQRTVDVEEQRKLRRLQVMMDMVMSVIGQDARLTVDQAAEMVADSKKAALAMFPDKELAYNLIYKPRLQRLMRERFRIQ